MAENGSDALAIRDSSQENHTAQVGIAHAVPTGGDTSGVPGVLYTEETTVTLEGDDDVDNPLLTIDEDADSVQKQDVSHQPDAGVDQYQSLFQENPNDQQAAIAVAADGGDATSSQVGVQSTEYVQFGSAVAASAISA